ncbi:hypothetical protein HOF65_01180 [bacterium]|nr:hypothetical protein [bacterium]
MFFIFLQNSSKSFCKLGSHQQIDTAVRSHFLFSKKLKKSFSFNISIFLIFSGNTNSLL